MKILCGLLLSIFSSHVLQAQWATSLTYIYNTNTGGNVGIGYDGTNAPAFNLDVTSAATTTFRIGTTVTTGLSDLILKGNLNFWKISKSAQGAGTTTAPGDLTFYYNTNVYGGDRFVLNLHHDTNTWSAQFGSPSFGLGSNVNLSVYGSMAATKLVVSGTNTWPIAVGGTCLVAVDGRIGAREVLITAATLFPDYVFKKGYALRTLLETDAFIQSNSHLPNIPTASEVNQNGLELGKMSILLTEKVEELTLYIIELKKEQETLKKEINLLSPVNSKKIRL